MFFDKRFILILSMFVSGTSAGFRCDFTKGKWCGYNKEREKIDENFRWKLHSDSGSRYSDPQVASGSFLSIEPKDGTDMQDFEDTVSLHSKTTHVKPVEHCLILTYRMFGPNVGSLRINFWDNFVNHVYPLFEKSGNHGESWHTTRVTWLTKESFLSNGNLVIVATREPNIHGEIAISSIDFVEGKCNEEVGISCTFSGGDCGWSGFKDWKDSSSWHIADHSNVGPATDHTSGTAFGGYAVANLKDNAMEIRTPSTVDTQLLPNDAHCLTFYYNLGKYAALYVVIEQTMSGMRIWSSQPSDPQNKWLPGEATVFPTHDVARVEFYAKIRGGQKQSTYVALDDVSVRTGECQKRGDQDFENGLGLYESTVGQFDWIVASSKDFDKVTGVDLKDHTQETITGHFLLAYFKAEGEDNKARLISPIFQAGDVVCLQFYYHFSTANAGTLDVHYAKDKKGRYNIIASKSSLETSSYGVGWNYQSIELKDVDKSFQIIFEATAGNDDSGFIAIDDIMVSDSSCADHDSLVSWSRGPPPHEPSEFDCDFEENNLCEWRQLDGSDFDVLVTEASTQELPSDPTADHSGKENGIVLRTTSAGTNKAKGGIQSPTLAGNSDGHCLSFWYYIHGSGVSMQIVKAMTSSGDESLLWQLSLTEGPGWHFAEIMIKADTEFQIKIILQKLSKEGTAALDEILYSAKACYAKEINTVDTCDFETGLCGLRQSPGSKESWTLSSGVSIADVEAPNGDNTYNTDKGHFLLFDQSKTDSGSTAIQETSTLIDDTVCLRFQYFISGSDVGSLEVMEISDYGSRTLWQAQGDHGNLWVPGRAEVFVEEGSQVKIGFRATAGEGTKGAIGLDEISLRQGHCPAKGTCGFDHFDTCEWYHDPEESREWYFYAIGKDIGIVFHPGFLLKGTLISPQFDGGQVRCIHFSYAHREGKGRLFLSKVPAAKKDQKDLLWQMVHSEDNTFETLKPARVSVHSSDAYAIHLSAEAYDVKYHIRIDNIKITNQPCLAEPSEAVSFDCDFKDGTTCFWYQDLEDDYDWIVPKKSSKFAFLEPAFKKDNTVGRLVSPLIPSGSRCLKFESLRYGANVGCLKVFMDVGHKRVTYVNWQGGQVINNWEKSSLNLPSDDNYQLVIEGVCNNGPDCDIGITKIEVLPSQCPDTWQKGSENPHCDFESEINPLCQWVTIPSKHVSSCSWKREGGLNTAQERALTMDYTFGAAGHYVYVAPLRTSKPKEWQATTDLKSPMLNGRKDGPYCMVFAYFIENGGLTIFQVPPGEKVTSDDNLWDESLPTGYWRKGFVTLKTMDTFQVVFRANLHRQASSDDRGVALDEIFLHKGPCDSWKDKCDFSEDLCLWNNVVDGTDAFDWRRSQTELVADEGPLKDHTGKGTDGTEGYFLIATQYFANSGDKARLLSAMYHPTDKISEMCLQFYYFMGGTGSAVLDVKILRGFENSKEPETSLSLWKLETGNTKRKEWLKATVKLDEFFTETSFKLAFEVTIDDGAVAIDDVQILSEVCETTPDKAVSLASVLADVSCSFDSDSNPMCGWRNEHFTPSAPTWKVEEYGPDSQEKRSSDKSTNGKYLTINLPSGHTGEWAVLGSPVLPKTNGVECFRFQYYISSPWQDSFRVQMTFDGKVKLLWRSEHSSTWTEVFINIYSIKPFQLFLEAGDIENLHVEDFYLYPGACPKEDKCRFGTTYCGFSQDDTDDYDWRFTYERQAIQAKPTGNSENKGRIISPHYAGGGPQCIQLRYVKVARHIGEMSLYIKEWGQDELGENLWTMPDLKTLFTYKVRRVDLPIHQKKPFQIVLEHKLGTGHGYSPYVLSLWLLSHPCEPLGWCDFEEDFCSYYHKKSFGDNDLGWHRFSEENSGEDDRQSEWVFYPYVDHTYGVPEGTFAAVTLTSTSTKAEMTGPIMPKTSGSCLTFAYALTGSANLEVSLNIEGSGKKTLKKISETTEGNHATLWKESHIHIQADQNFDVIFEAYSTKDGSDSHASLDDIKVLSGSCDEQKALDKPTAPEIIKDLSCDFEEASDEFCNYKPVQHISGEWKRSQGNSDLPGPDFDHTRDNGKGHFASLMHTKGSSSLATLAMTRELLSVPGCLSFWYQLSGDPYNEVTVSTEEFLILYRTTEQSRVWQHALVDLNLQQPGDRQDSSNEKKLYAFNISGARSGNHGYVALDDIQVYSGICPITDTCEFEDDGLCDFTQISHETRHWERKKAGDIVALRKPYTDRTYGTTEGHVMFCCSGGYQESVSMLSPVYKGNPHGRCLSFWTIASRVWVDILTRDKEGHENKLESVYSNYKWNVHKINVRQRTDFQVIFRISGRSTNTAIDQIKVSSRPCHEHYNCDFTMGFCTWTQKAEGKAAWQIAGHASVGPKFDHTANSEAGQYIILQGADESDVTDKTTLTSEIIAGIKSDELCFSFWYHMSDTKAGSLSVTTPAGNQTWGPFTHDEEGWLHEMMTVPVFEYIKFMQISLVATIEPGEENYIAVDDLKLLGTPCIKVQHDKEFSCKDADKTKLPYDKVCDFTADCANNADEQDCGSCDFETSKCRFVDGSGESGWERIKGDPQADSEILSSADGYFLFLRQNRDSVLASFESSNSFRPSPPECKLTFNLYISKGDLFSVDIKTRMGDTLIKQFQLVTSNWDSQMVAIGNVNVPFQINFGTFALGTDGIGIDNIKMLDCDFHLLAVQDKCLKDEFHCDNKACILSAKVCDFQNDCGDFSDEKNCDNMIRDDFEYSLGNWNHEEQPGGTMWSHLFLNQCPIYYDHTGGPASKGGYLQCGRMWQKKKIICLIASPFLMATDKENLCQIRFYFINSKNELNVYTRAKGSSDLEEVPFTSMPESIWSRAIAPLTSDTDFQVVIKGTRKLKDNLGGFCVASIALDDVSFTEGCRLSDDVTTEVTPDPEVIVPDERDEKVEIKKPSGADTQKPTDPVDDEKPAPAPVGKDKGEKEKGQTSTKKHEEKPPPAADKVEKEKGQTSTKKHEEKPPPAADKVEKEKGQTSTKKDEEKSPPAADKVEKEKGQTSTKKDEERPPPAADKVEKEKGQTSTKKDEERPPPAADKSEKDTDKHPLEPPSVTGADTREELDTQQGKDTSKKEQGKGTNEKVTKDVPQKSAASWQLPVGLTSGAVALVLIAVVVIFMLRRTNTIRGLLPINYQNAVYDENTQEMEETNYGSQGVMANMYDPVVLHPNLTLENPTFKEVDP